MAIWDKLRTELDRAGRAAQDALDEGRVRLDAFRARQQADKAAQAIGYAVFRARQQGGDVDAETYARLSADLAAREAEAKRLEERAKEIGARRKGQPADQPADTASPPSPPSSNAGTPDTNAGANI